MKLNLPRGRFWAQKIGTYGLLLAFFTGFSGHAAAAHAPGQIYPKNDSPHIYRITLKQGALTNVVGSTAKYTYDLGGNFEGYSYCTSPNLYIPSAPFIYTARTSLPPSDMNGHLGYRKLNEYIDVRIDIHVAGRVNAEILAPFESFSNQYNDNTARCNTANPPFFTSTNFRSSSKGTVTFKLRRPVINGVSVNSREIIEMYGVLDMPGAGIPGLGSVPMARLFIETALLTVPDKCVVNNGNIIDVDFKDIPQASLDGSRYVETIPVSYKCTGGSFDSGVKGISIGVSARPASFSDSYMDTTTKNLGIVLKHNGKVVKPNEFTKMPKSQTNVGTWDLTAAPITFGSDIGLGQFTANGTIVMEFSEID